MRIACAVAAVGALGWLLGEIGWTVVSSSLKSVGLVGAAVLVLLSVAESLCDGAALRVIVGSTVSTTKVVTVHMAGSFMNMMLPLDSGEFLKMAMLREQLGTTAAVSGVGVWNYLFKLTRPLVSSLAAILAIGLGNRSDARVLSLVCIANACAFLPFVFIRWGVRHGGTTAVLEFVRRVPLLRNLSHNWLETARAVDERLQNFWQVQRSTYLKSCLLQMAARLFGCVALYVTIKSLNLSYTLSDALLVYASMNVVDYLVAVLPAKLGPLEGSAYFTFALLGLSAPMGVIVYIVMRLKSIVGNGLAAPFVLLRRSEGPHENLSLEHATAKSAAP